MPCGRERPCISDAGGYIQPVALGARQLLAPTVRDIVHPSASAHVIIGREMYAVVPEPASSMLLLAAVLALLVSPGGSFFPHGCCAAATAGLTARAEGGGRERLPPQASTLRVDSGHRACARLGQG